MIQIGKLTLGHHYTTNWDMSLSSSNFCQKKDSQCILLTHSLWTGKTHTGGSGENNLNDQGKRAVWGGE